MAKGSKRPLKKPYAKAIILGLVSVGLYYAIFINEAYVREVWAKGGAYTILPIATVFIFSFVHGSFANYLFSVLGIEAKKKH